VKKASDNDFAGRFREIIMDPLNLLINRVHNSGTLNEDRVILHNGIEVRYSGDYAYYGDFSQILILNRGVHEPLEEFIFQELLKKLPESSSMIELGAYWGHYSMWLKKTKLNSKTTLVEAEEHNLNVGKFNFNRLGFTANFIQQRVGHRNFSIDKFFNENSIDHLNLLHSDIQGYELEMIIDSSNTLSNYAIDYLMISTHSQSLHYSVIEHLVKHNYDIEVTSDFDNETTSCDGFILASSPKIDKVVSNWKPLSRLEIVNLPVNDIFNYINTTKQNFNL
jgi:hypothetical protein